jgi:hypothetical protein
MNKKTSAKDSGTGILPVVLAGFSIQTGQAGSLSHYFPQLNNSHE